MFLPGSRLLDRVRLISVCSARGSLHIYPVLGSEEGGCAGDGEMLPALQPRSTGCRARLAALGGFPGQKRLLTRGCAHLHLALYAKPFLKRL